MKELICPNCNADLLGVGVYSRMNVQFKFKDGKVLFLNYANFDLDEDGSPFCCEECNQEISDNDIVEKLNLLLDEIPTP